MDLNDGKHAEIPGSIIYGLAVFGSVAGFNKISWVEECPPNTAWVETPPIQIGTKYCGEL